MNDSLFFRSAFFWYSQDERPKVRAANPEFNVGDVAKELGRRWADAGPELKSKYEALAEKDRARYGNAKREYQISLKNGGGGIVPQKQPIVKNGGDPAEEDSGEEDADGNPNDDESPPNKVPNLNSYPSQQEEEEAMQQNMQERVIPEESVTNDTSETHKNEDGENSLNVKNTNNNDSSLDTSNNDDAAVDHHSNSENETQAGKDTDQEQNGKTQNGDTKNDEEDEDLGEDTE